MLMYYVILAEGFEEIEALIQTDVLRRAGVKVMNASLSEEYVTGAHGITVKSDISIDEAIERDDAEGIILPGGMPGTLNIEKSEKATYLIKKTYDENKLVAAICAAPSVLGKMGLLKGKNAVCYPGFEDSLSGACVKYTSVERDGNVITSRGPGTALDFAYAVTGYITGKAPDKLAAEMIYEKG